MIDKIQVLIVDDSPMNLKLARVALESEGYEVRTAADGGEAWQLLSSFAPSAILMDLQMPGLDGFELTRRIKADPQKAQIKIVAVTAYAMKGDRERALEAGCDGYIAKPIDPILLPGLIASHLGARPPDYAAPDGSEAILIVEDNPTSRKMIRVALESEGHRVVEAGEGRAALEWLSTQRACLIVQDLVLPDIDGLELVQRLRALPNGRHVPILCLSGFLARMDDAKVIKNGFSALLLKPIDPIQLLETVRGHLDRAHSRPPPARIDHGVHVLVVDDDPLQRRLAEYHLSNVGFRVSLAADAKHALESAELTRPDAIISDVLMPEMDGFELCLRIRRHPTLAKVPVVLISSHYKDEADQRLAEQVGANALVERSGDWAGALSIVRDVLSQPASTRPASNADSAREAILRRTLAQLHHQLRVNTDLSQQCLLDAAQLSVLAGVAESLAHNTKLDGVLADVLALCLDVAGISKGALYLREARELIPRHSIGFAAGEVAGLRDFFGQHVLLQTWIASGQVTSIPSAALSGETAQQFLRSAGVHSALVVPVAWGRAFYGALLLGARGADMTGQEPAAFARVLGGQMGQAIGLADAFERLTTSEEQFRTLVASMEDVTVVDRTEHVTGIYGRARVHGVDASAHSTESLIGKALRELPEYSSALAHAYARAFAGESAVHDWSRGVGTAAQHFQDSIWPVRSPEGAVISVVRVRRDVTEQKRLQAQVMSSDRMVSVGMLAAGVAHEINNPLMAVLGNVQLALDGLDPAVHPEGDELRESLKDALEASQRVESIVRDLRLFSRAEDDRMSAVEVESVLESTLRLARTEIRHRARLVKDYRTNAKVRCNESRLGQVFLNLLVNAAQAIPEGRADTNEIRLASYLDTAGRVVVEISDTGSGIPEAVRAQLFTPFVTTKPVGVGTGLGLAICQRIVTGFGGEITFESQVGRGTSFRVALPVDSAPEVENSFVPYVGAATRRGRIAMIDDELVLCSLVKKALSREHDVVCFSEATSALQRFSVDANFDVILCDLMMPVVTGVEFYDQLAVTQPKLAERIVFLTGGAFTPEAHAFLERAAKPCVSKPFDVRKLRAMVNERIG